MICYIENKNTDPFYNLALEQFVFDSLDRRYGYFMLWQNDNSIIVGKHQNTISEINPSFVKMNNIKVARRLSGGGAVYHDLGNINFTFITDADRENAIDLNAFCQPVKKALQSFGVPAEITGRNDITVEEKKISGNAQYVRQGRVMHHGTLLYDSDLDMLSMALNAPDDKIESKGIKSVKSRVANIRPFMKEDMSADEFRSELKKHFAAAFNMKEYFFSEGEEGEIQRLRENIYSQWSWNYGASPPFNVRKIRRIEGCGTVEALIDVEKNGVIKNISFFGDFFGIIDVCELAQVLEGRHFELNEIKNIIKNIDITQFFHNITENVFMNLLFT